MASKEINYYGGLCPEDNKKLEFKNSDKTEEGFVILFAVCPKCDGVYFLDFKKSIFAKDEFEIDYTKILEK